MAKCQSCNGTGEKTIRVKEKDLRGRNTGFTIPTTVACTTCRGTGQR